MAHRLSKEGKPAAIYSSDLKRAAETAEIVAKVCGVTNVRAFYSFFFERKWNKFIVYSICPASQMFFFQLVVNEALREMHMGYLQGLKWDDAVNKNPDVFRSFGIFEITEGSDPDSRNKEIPVNSHINLSRLKY